MADPVSVLKDYDAACNTHDVEGVMAFVTDDAVVRLEPAPPDEFGGVYRGKEQIRAGYVEPLMAGFHVDSRDHQVAGHQEGVGDSVIWTASVSGDFFRQMGAEPPVESNAEAVVETDKLKSPAPLSTQGCLRLRVVARETTLRRLSILRFRASRLIGE
jgi:ketosteroid isomerase-like protein